MGPINIYTDGSSRGNPGPGGYGIVLQWGDKQKEISQGFRLTTNNRMELTGVIVALETLTRNDVPIVIYTDSKYIVDSVEKRWLDGWMKNDFKGGKKNKDLWLQYHQLSKDFKVKMKWVKGHADNAYNNRRDILATKAADGENLLLDEGYESIVL